MKKLSKPQRQFLTELRDSVPLAINMRVAKPLVDRGLCDFQTRITLKGTVCDVLEEWWITEAGREALAAHL